MVVVMRPRMLLTLGSGAVGGPAAWCSRVPAGSDSGPDCCFLRAPWPPWVELSLRRQRARACTGVPPDSTLRKPGAC